MNKKLFIGGLPFGTLEPSLREWLTKWGITVLSLSNPQEGKNGGRPFAFLTLPKEQAKKAMQLLDKKSFGTPETGYEIIGVREAA